MLAALLPAAFTTLAQAGVIYSLNQDACSGGCGVSPFGTVTLSQVNAQTVMVSEVLFTGNLFINAGAGDALEFNITGNPAITISNISAGFSVGPAPDSASAFGSFDYSVTCSGCGSGASAPLPGPLEFKVTLTGGGNLSVSDFVVNGDGYMFASDIIGNSGNTGNVGSNDPGLPSGVPEPSAGLLSIAGLALLGGIRKLRQLA